MIARLSTSPSPSAFLAGLSLLALASSLGGCAGLGDGMLSGAFVDPAKYSQFDCKQLETERTNLAKRTAELDGLMDKARTGTGGAVVAEVAYRNDYISTRAQAKLAEENWQKSKCVASPPSATPVAVPPPTPAKGHKRTHDAAG